MLRFIALQGVRVHENVECSQRRENVIYRDLSCVVQLLLHLKNKQQIMKKTWRLNTSTDIRYTVYW